MIRIYHYRHQRKLGVPLSAYPTALLRVVLSCWEAVAETALLPKSFQMVAEEITSLEAGSPWRTGDGQLGKLSGPSRDKCFRRR